MQEGNIQLEDFLCTYHAKNLVKEPTCFKSVENPSCVDLFITNKYRSFMKTSTISTGLSDFHKMITTVMRTTFPKAEPSVITYRKMGNYNSVDFSIDLGFKFFDGIQNFALGMVNLSQKNLIF